MRGAWGAPGLSWPWPWVRLPLDVTAWGGRDLTLDLDLQTTVQNTSSMPGGAGGSRLRAAAPRGRPGPPRAWWVRLLLVLLVLQAARTRADAVAGRWQALREAVLEGYDRGSPPPRPPGAEGASPVTVFLSLNFHRIFEVRRRRGGAAAGPGADARRRLGQRRSTWSRARWTSSFGSASSGTTPAWRGTRPPTTGRRRWGSGSATGRGCPRRPRSGPRTSSCGTSPRACRPASR